MARGLNKVMIIGNLGRDPEMRYTPSGRPVTSFSLASSRTWVPPDGERREETEWFRIVAWNRLAEQCNQYITKGMRVYAEGRLKSDQWTGKDGQNRFTNEINAFQVLFLDRATAAEPGGEPGGEGGAPGSAAGDVEDLPW